MQGSNMYIYIYMTYIPCIPIRMRMCVLCVLCLCVYFVLFCFGFSVLSSCLQLSLMSVIVLL